MEGKEEVYLCYEEVDLNNEVLVLNVHSNFLYRVCVSGGWIRQRGYRSLGYGYLNISYAADYHRCRR